MRIDVKNAQETAGYIGKIDSYVKSEYGIEWTKYVALGSKTVRLVNYSKEFTPLVEKQLTYSLKDGAPGYDATIVLWREKDISAFLNKIIGISSQVKMRIRVEMLASKCDKMNVEIVDASYSQHNPVIIIDSFCGLIRAYDSVSNTYYYGVEDLSPEEFIKQGHIFVQFFNKIVKTPTSNLVHGAVVGLDNKGVLFCARGQRGKSTLAVLAMMEGFEYVSDDYLILEKEGNELYSYPIYSIITLSPRMYNELYYDLKGKFVSNNARRDKYVINIADYHDTFRDKYPVKVCMFPEIVSDARPSIVPCEKGRAVTQLIHSTIRQTEDKHDIKTIRKLMDFVKDYDFYQINLCPDIKANVECLREFCRKIK